MTGPLAYSGINHVTMINVQIPEIKFGYQIFNKFLKKVGSYDSKSSNSQELSIIIHTLIGFCKHLY